MEKRPEYLKNGDKIGIVATARKISKEEIEPAIDIIEKWGLQAVYTDALFHEDHQYAGSDQHRAEQIQLMIENPEIKAIWCARGGYGTIRTLDFLDFESLCKKPKWIIGYSDITVLHSHINKWFGLETIHGPMLLNFSDNDSAESLRKALFGEKLKYTTPAHPLNKEGKTTGKLIGGNLSVLFSLNGTPSDIDTQDCILFIEDLDEYLYHIDRMAENFLRSGKFSRLKGIIVGGMTDMNDNTIPFGTDAESIIKEKIRGFSYPQCFGFPAGHKEPNMSLYMGRECILEVREEGSLLHFA